MDMRAYTLVELIYLETVANIFIFPVRQNPLIQETIFRNAKVRRFAIAMNTNSAFFGSYTENPFWNQQFDIRQIKKLRGGQQNAAFMLRQ